MPMEATTNIIVRTPDVFLTASEVAEILGISRPFAYKIIKQMNNELETQGFMTIAGRVASLRTAQTLRGETSV